MTKCPIGSTINDEHAHRRLPSHLSADSHANSHHHSRPASGRGLYSFLRPYNVDSDGDSNSSKSNFEHFREQSNSEEEKEKKPGKVRQRVTSLMRKGSHNSHNGHKSSSNDEHHEQQNREGKRAGTPEIVLPKGEGPEASPNSKRPTELKERHRVSSIFHKLTHSVSHDVFSHNLLPETNKTSFP